MNGCFFCGPTDTPLTEEHVWPKWVSRLLLERYNSDHFRHLRAAGDNTTANWRSRHLDVTTTTVCSSCNNEWLSIFENDQIKPLASPLIVEGEAVELTPKSQSRLAAWAYKMAMLVEVANPDQPVEFFTPAETTVPPDNYGASTRARVSEQVRLRPSACARADPVSPISRENRRSADLLSQDLYDNGWAPCNAGHIGSVRRIERACARERDRVRILRHCERRGDPDLAYCAGISFVASGSYDEP